MTEQLDEKARMAIRAALRRRDLPMFEGTLVALTIVYGVTPAEAERISREELAALPAASRAWWEDPCNCNGLLN